MFPMQSHERSAHRAAGLALALALLPVLALAQTGGPGHWPYAGHDLHNTRNAEHERRISPRTAPHLYVKWVFTAEGDVSATPAVDGKVLYFPDWGGWLHKVDAATGARIWSRRISDYTGVPGSISRNTPALHDNRLFFGTLKGDFLAVDARSGDLIWKMHADPHPTAVITQSPIVFGNRVYVGISSYESSIAEDPSYPCCTFRGNVLALDARTGAVVWRTHTVPEGYSGGSVWGSTLVLDTKRNSLYVPTGNNYSVPPAVRACLLSAPDEASQSACLSPDNHFDSVLSLDPETGAIKWSRTLFPLDIFILSCLTRPEDCPPPAGPDYDLGQGTILYKARGPDGRMRELLGAGQKSGMYRALDPDTGAIVWGTQVSPGSVGGGLLWGSAMADGRIYAASANLFNLPYTLPSGETSSWGNFTALDAATGQILWQTPDPVVGSHDLAPVTTANGVVFGCSIDPLGHMYALDASTGAVLWTFVSGGSCNAGAAVANGTVYWGSGYSNFNVGTPNNKLYAFTVPSPQ
jgi:polyvinyl alcohol dehydrogenase (cytochrome)